MKKREEEPTNPLPIVEIDRASAEPIVDQPCLLILNGLGSGRVVSLEHEITIGRDSQADLQLLDESASRLHARVVTENTLVRIEDLNSTNGTLVNGLRITSPRELHDGDMISVGSTCVLKFSYRGRLRQEFEQGLYDRASRDGLTGAYSRQFFDQYFRGELSYARRHNQPFAVLLVEIDKLGGVYESHGWIVGDSLQIELVRTILGMLRDDDICARYQDARFVILRRLVSVNQAMSLGGRLRSEFSSDLFDGPAPTEPLKATISVGIAHFPTHCDRDAETLLPLADRALRVAKKAGGNRLATPDQWSAR